MTAFKERLIALKGTRQTLFRYMVWESIQEYMLEHDKEPPKTCYIRQVPYNNGELADTLKLNEAVVKATLTAMRKEQIVEPYDETHWQLTQLAINAMTDYEQWWPAGSYDKDDPLGINQAIDLSTQ